MFARTVRMQLKPNSVAEFTSVIEKEIIPLLRKQQGFRDEITFLPPDNGKEAVAISLWEQKENAEAYGRGTYPNVLKAMAKVVWIGSATVSLRVLLLLPQNDCDRF